MMSQDVQVVSRVETTLKTTWRPPAHHDHHHKIASTHLACYPSEDLHAHADEHDKSELENAKACQQHFQTFG